MAKRWLFSALLLLIGLVGVGLAQSPQYIFLPFISHTLVIPDPDEVSARLQVADGYVARQYAAGLNRPRLMAIGPDGMLYVAERGANRIVRLPDQTGDGRADEVIAVATNLPGVHSLTWHDGDLYAAGNATVWRLRDNDNNGSFSSDEVTVIVTGLPNDGGHSTRTARIGPDGMLYVSVGSKCNITVGCSEGDPRRAAILRYTLDGDIPDDNPFINDPDPRRRAVWAEGLRNSVDFIFLPDGRLWATHNGSDGLGNDLPPEEVVINVERGRHYGWPYCYTAELGPVPVGAQEVRDERVPLDQTFTSCAQATPALFTELAHYAPLGLDRLPDGDLLIAYHGSWNADDTPRDCRVQRIRVSNGVPVSAEPFLTGFRDHPQQECGGAWGRPAGVTIAPNGVIFVSDDRNGNIYRIVPNPGGQ
ncbi:PQQ-dependent sugar dehydrogenase [Chloroflexus sp.]|uniref:PQQ-dependent sugar dehydrogenase n=1 Tax=Chloroflexus sp. TaxID=1904827 RepID=UPI0026037CDF|nr:PQQ-dependent sugar dehydrogenase [uncultured Chloroflexus sp.]